MVSATRIASGGTTATTTIAITASGNPSRSMHWAQTRAVFERYNVVSADDLREAAQRLDLFASGAVS
jgi:hypothetical protein